MSEEEYPHTAIVKFGDRWAPATIAKTSISPAYPGETWLQALERATAPSVHYRIGFAVPDWRMSDEQRKQTADFLEWWGPAKRRAERDLAIARALPIAIITGLLVAILLRAQ